MREPERSLGDVAAELEGPEALIDMVAMLVAPTEEAVKGSVPTQETVDRAFYSIASTVRLIRGEVNEWETRYLALSKADA